MPDRLPSDDTQLVRLAASCSEDAFCEVIKRFDRHIASVLRRYASRPTDREDLHSEIVAKLLANRKRALRAWRPSASFGAYVATIAARHCMDWLSRRGRLPRTRLSSRENNDPNGILEETISADRAYEPQHRLEASGRRKALHEAIERLSESDRLVLYLRFDQELSGLEIADFLGISHVAARQRLFRAVRRLEDQVQQLCPELAQPDEH